MDYYRLIKSVGSGVALGAGASLLLSSNGLLGGIVLAKSTIITAGAIGGTVGALAYWYEPTMQQQVNQIATSLAEAIGTKFGCPPVAP